MEEIEETSSHKVVADGRIHELTDDDAVHRLDKSDTNSHADIDTFRVKKGTFRTGLYSAKAQIKNLSRGRMPNYSTVDKVQAIKFRGRSNSSH